jgi:hypothetical protein
MFYHFNEIIINIYYGVYNIISLILSNSYKCYKMCRKKKIRHNIKVNLSNKIKIITLCGSTSFKPVFECLNLILSYNGKIVLQIMII